MKSAVEELKEAREHLISSFCKGVVEEDFQEKYTEIIDQYFRRSLQESDAVRSLFKEKRTFAFVAVGGYGRSELCRHSDIDILILFGSKMASQAKRLAEEILYPLWDLGLDLGYGIRTTKDCLVLCRDDFEILSSMMDSRFVCGDSLLYLTLIERLQEKVISKKAVAFARWLEERNRLRGDIFGDASYLLEPNLKDGIGGLRDYHHILWFARAFLNLRVPRDLEYLGKLSHTEFLELQTQLRFIWLVRNHLHHLSDRKNDRLGFEHQERIAQTLMFKDQKDLLAVEQFMGRLHAAMGCIKALYRAFVESQRLKRQPAKRHPQPQDISGDLHVYRGEINFNSATAILSNPFLLMDVFEFSARTGCPISLEAKRLVREFLSLVDDTFRVSKWAVQGFLNIMNGANAFDTLNQMLETGFLGAFIPEFERIAERVQFDTYHVFPVGRHALETVKYLKAVADQSDLLLADVFTDLSNREPLFLAGLFHDIGKVGRDHALKGLEISRKILKRFEYDRKGTEEILFLVRHHLVLAETAIRRDLGDEKVVVQCARAIGDLRRLKMLYLLTWADSRGTGPRAWNEWIASLVQDLFFKVLHILERGELATPDASQRVKQTVAQVRREVRGRVNQDDIASLLDIMSPRYLLKTSPEAIVKHLTLVQGLRGKKRNDVTCFAFETRQDEPEGYWEITFLAEDRPGLFSHLAGTLALNNINILSALIYTWRDGTAVDVLRVTPPLDRILADRIWKKLEGDLRDTLSGRLDLASRLKQKASSILCTPKRPSRPPRVLMDNESSDFFTLIEVFADDRVGLLFLITHALFRLGLDIKVAKIATKGDQVADVFYVRDLEGQKVEDAEQAEEIKKALLLALGHN